MTFRELLDRLKEEAGDQHGGVYLVGGCVRDGLMGRPLVDADLAVERDALAYARRLADRFGGSYVPLGERFSVARVVLQGEPADRCVVSQIDVAALQGGLESDLARRDYTVNAMAVELARFTGAWEQAPVVDPLGGQQDLARGLLRMVSPEVLDADPLRMLRAVRLSAELALSIEPGTAAAIRERAPLLGRSAPERVREELCRILESEQTAAALEQLDGLGLLDVIFPEVAGGRGVEQPREHHWDVFRHQVEAVAAVEALLAGGLGPATAGRPYLRDASRITPFAPGLEGYFDLRLGGMSRRALLKLTALFHDAGKPETKTFEPSGRMRFFGHEDLGAQMAETALGRLRFSKQEVRAVVTMIAHHLRPGQWSSGEVPSRRAMYRFFRDLDEVAVDTIFLNLADHLAARGPGIVVDHWKRHVAVAEEVLREYFREQEQQSEPRIITGRDIIEVFGLEPGPQIGRLLAEVEEARATGAVRSREEALALVRRLNT